MSLADQIQTVHTSGINWESIAVIAGVLLTIVTAFVGWIGKRISQAVDNLSEKLELKLETKDAVNAINTRLTRVEQSLADRGRR